MCDSREAHHDSNTDSDAPALGEKEKWLRAIEQHTPPREERVTDSLERASIQLSTERGIVTDGKPSPLSW